MTYIRELPSEERPWLDLNGQRVTVQSVMMEVGPHRYVNLKCAKALGLVSRQAIHEYAKAA